VTARNSFGIPPPQRQPDHELRHHQCDGRDHAIIAPPGDDQQPQQQCPQPAAPRPIEHTGETQRLLAHLRHQRQQSRRQQPGHQPGIIGIGSPRYRVRQTEQRKFQEQDRAKRQPAPHIHRTAQRRRVALRRAQRQVMTPLQVPQQAGHRDQSQRHQPDCHLHIQRDRPPQVERVAALPRPVPGVVCRADQLIARHAHQHHHRERVRADANRQHHIQQARTYRQRRRRHRKICRLQRHRTPQRNQQHRERQADPPPPDHQRQQWKQQQHTHQHQFLLHGRHLDHAGDSLQRAPGRHTPHQVGAARPRVQRRVEISHALHKGQADDRGLDESQNVPSQLRHRRVCLAVLTAQYRL